MSTFPAKGTHAAPRVLAARTRDEGRAAIAEAKLGRVVSLTFHEGGFDGAEDAPALAEAIAASAGLRELRISSRAGVNLAGLADAIAASGVVVLGLSGAEADEEENEWQVLPDETEYPGPGRDAEVLARMLDGGWSPRRLEVDVFSLRAEHHERILRAAGGVRELALGRFDWTLDVAEALREILMPQSSLKSLEIHGSGVYADAAAQACVRSGMGRLERLDFMESVRDDYAGLCGEIGSGRATLLRYLRLGGTAAPEPLADAAEYLDEITASTDEPAELFERIRRNERLAVLRIRGVGPEHAVALAGMMHENRALRTLDVSNHTLDAAGFELLLHAALWNPTLRTIVAVSSFSVMEDTAVCEGVRVLRDRNQGLDFIL